MVGVIPSCGHCGALLTGAEMQYYGTACERCETELHAALVEEREPVLPVPTEAETRQLLAELEQELGVKGASAVFRKALALAKEARAQVSPGEPDA